MIARLPVGVGSRPDMLPVRAALARPLALCLLLLSACGKEKVVAAACREDPDCDTGLLCEDFRCVPANTKACEVVLDGNPVLQPAPYAANFGDVDVPDSSLTLTLHNRRSMKILFAICVTPLNTLNVAFKANRAPSREFCLHKSRQTV